MQDWARVARLSALVHALIHAYMLVLPALVPRIAAHYGVSLLTVDSVGTVHYLAFGLGAVPAGFIADRLGARRLLLGCLGGCLASAVVVALAPSFPIFAVGLICLGASASAYHPAGLSMISRAAPPDALGRAIGIHGVGGNLGEALAPATAAILAAAAGWRAPFVLCAGTALLAMLPVAALPSGARSAGERSDLRARGRGFGLHLIGPLGIVLLSALASGLVYRGATYFLPRHLSAHIDAGALASLTSGMKWLTAGKSSDALGAIVTSLALLAGVFSQWWGGRLADRFRRDRLFVVLAAVIAPLTVLLAVLRDLPLLLAAIGFGFVWYLGQPLLNSIAAGFVARERHGILYGLMFSTSFGLGSFAVSAGAWAATRWSTSAAFLGLAGVAVVNVALAARLSLSMNGAGDLPRAALLAPKKG